MTCPVTTLAPGASTTCTSAAYTITQPDVDAAHVANTATASAKTPTGGALTSPPSSTDTPVAQSPGPVGRRSRPRRWTRNGDFKIDLGDTITWSFLVKNTGTVSVTGVAVNDPKAGAVSCPATTLAPGASTTCTAPRPYVITQADVDAGVVSNTATASATTPAGGAGHVAAVLDRHDRRPGERPEPGQVGGGHRRQRRRQDRPRRHDRLVVRGQEHGHDDGEHRCGRRPQGRRGDLSGDDVGAGCVDDVHVRGVHDHAARCRRGACREHGDGVGQAPERRRADLAAVVDRHPGRAEPGPER